MSDLRKMIPKVESIVKRIDSKIIVQSMYDSVSDRLMLTLVDGVRKVIMTLYSRDFEDQQLEKVNRALQDGLDRLKHVPIG